MPLRLEQHSERCYFERSARRFIMLHVMMITCHEPTSSDLQYVWSWSSRGDGVFSSHTGSVHVHFKLFVKEIDKVQCVYQKVKLIVRLRTIYLKTKCMSWAPNLISSRIQENVVSQTYSQELCSEVFYKMASFFCINFLKLPIATISFWKLTWKACLVMNCQLVQSASCLQPSTAWEGSDLDCRPRLPSQTA